MEKNKELISWQRYQNIESSEFIIVRKLAPGRYQIKDSSITLSLYHLAKNYKYIDGTININNPVFYVNHNGFKIRVPKSPKAQVAC